MKLMLASLLVTSLASFAIGERSNEERFGYGVKLKTKGRLKVAMTEIHTNREKEYIDMFVAKDDINYETHTFIDLINNTVAYQASSMDGCGLMLLPENINFDDVMQVVKRPPRYRLGIEGLVCHIVYEGASRLIQRSNITELCDLDDEPFEIKHCRPAEHNDRPEDECLVTGYTYNAKDKVAGLYCIREFRKH